MRRFDYGFLKNQSIPAPILGLIAHIYELRAHTQYHQDRFPTVFSALEKIAVIQSVKTSNAIEGIITSDQRIAEIVNRSSAPLNHDEQEIAGYRDSLSIIHTGHPTLPFSTQTVLDLHRTLLAVSGATDAGSYKTTDNVIVEIDRDGYRSVRFRPLPAADTAQAMEQLELAYLDAAGDSSINQLLLIPCVILDFLCIHPFRDGNGRMSRLLSLLLLYREGFDVGKYVSYEEQINRHKDRYYAALKASSDGWDTEDNDYMPFVENFLVFLLSCYQELAARFDTVDGGAITKTSRIQASVFHALTPISKAEIAAIHPDISPSTIEAVLGAMVKSGAIVRIGAGRASRYRRAQPAQS